MALKQIIVPLDGSVAAETAIPHAGRLARAFHARVLLLRVLNASPEDQSPHSVDWRMQKAEAKRYLRELAGLEALADLTVVVELNEGRPAECIISTANRVAADLIVMSAYGANRPSDFPFGGTAHKVLRGARLSVAIVSKPEAQSDTHNQSYRRLLVPIDGSQQAELALQFAVALAGSDEAMEIVLLHLVAVPAMPRRGPLSPEEQALHDQVVATNTRAAEHHLHEIQRQFRNNAHVACRLEVSANPVQTIVRVAGAEKADLLIMTCPEHDQTQHLCRRSACEAIQAISELPLLVLQSSGRS